jgi:hypothetical protein
MDHQVNPKAQSPEIPQKSKRKKEVVILLLKLAIKLAALAILFAHHGC